MERRRTRQVTGRICDAIDEGTLDADTVLMACLKYMSEDEVADMVRVNGFFESDDDE